jgi:hypothetical protein
MFSEIFKGIFCFIFCAFLIFSAKPVKLAADKIFG